VPSHEFDPEEFVIEPLGPGHDRSEFSCGDEALDRYLKQQARQDMRRHAAAVFVLHSGRKVAGYYALSNRSVHFGDFPAEITKKLPRYPLVPATLVGRLAVDKNHRGKGLGEFLLMDALRRSLEQTKQIGSVAVVVDAKNTEVRKFYESYGFIAFADDSLRLFLPMDTISELLGKD
jgi:predicted GNAT family N-acyltransferase